MCTYTISKKKKKQGLINHHPHIPPKNRCGSKPFINLSSRGLAEELVFQSPGSGSECHQVEAT